MATREPSTIQSLREESRTISSMNRTMPKGAPLGAGTPIGTVVGFKEYLEDGDREYRGVVIEDRGDNVLVSNMNSQLAFGSTQTYRKSELQKLGVDKDDDGKMGMIGGIANGDTQRIIFSNGSIISVTHGRDANGSYYQVGDYKVNYGNGTSKNSAIRKVQTRIRKMI